MDKRMGKGIPSKLNKETGKRKQTSNKNIRRDKENASYSLKKKMCLEYSNPKHIQPNTGPPNFIKEAPLDPNHTLYTKHL